jgi:uncharacterized protein YbcV (DUF1398 family)
MNAQQKAIAENCLNGSYNNTMTFPENVRTLMGAGFEGYHVDYRLNTRTYYLPNGETLVLNNPHAPDPVGEKFNQSEVAAAIKWAQVNPPGYNYASFNSRVAVNGCAGYIVSLLGRRVLYFGRTAETHVEHFPHDGGTKD